MVKTIIKNILNSKYKLSIILLLLSVIILLGVFIPLYFSLNSFIGVFKPKHQSIIKEIGYNVVYSLTLYTIFILLSMNILAFFLLQILIPVSQKIEQYLISRFGYEELFLLIREKTETIFNSKYSFKFCFFLIIIATSPLFISQYTSFYISNFIYYLYLSIFILLLSYYIVKEYLKLVNKFDIISKMNLEHIFTNLNIKLFTYSITLLLSFFVILYSINIIPATAYNATLKNTSLKSMAIYNEYLRNKPNSIPPNINLNFSYMTYTLSLENIINVNINDYYYIPIILFLFPLTIWITYTITLKNVKTLMVSILYFIMSFFIPKIISLDILNYQLCSVLTGLFFSGISLMIITIFKIVSARYLFYVCDNCKNIIPKSFSFCPYCKKTIVKEK